MSRKFEQSSIFLQGVWLLLGVILLAGPIFSQIGENESPDPGLEYLKREVSRLAALAKGTVGVAALHLETGRAMYLNKSIGFPMASTYKVPIAVEILTKVDQGKLSLDKLITIEQNDVYLTHGVISDFLNDPGVILSVRNILELMLQISDNNATDIMLRVAGGPEAVTARMKAVGADGIRVDRPTWSLISGYIGHPEITFENPVLPKDYLEFFKEYEAEEDKDALTQAFNQDPRDTATPEAMATLLKKIWHKEILSPESSDLLIDIMFRCKTGESRIKGLLPPGSRVAHKTGTIGESTNDVGIIELPDGAGNVVTVIYIKESKLPGNEDMEKVIAQIARAIHDFFLFNRK